MKLRVKLSQSSINSAKYYLRNLVREIEEVSNSTPEQLAELGKSIAAIYINSDTGELESSLNVVNLEDGHSQLEVNSPHAAFHEFGTGVVGQGTYPYPFPVPWKYNDGWKKNTRFDPNDPNKWFYVNPKDDRWHSTRGQQGHAFMAQAAEMLRQEAIPLVKARIVL